METREKAKIERNLEELADEYSGSYKRFVEHGNEFILVMDDAMRKIDDKWVEKDDILENTEEESPGLDTEQNRYFTSVYNLVCRADIIPAWGSSPPYRVDSDQYDSSPLIYAWEHASGKNYHAPVSHQLDSEIEELTIEELDDVYTDLEG